MSRSTAVFAPKRHHDLRDEDRSSPANRPWPREVASPNAWSSAAPSSVRQELHADRCRRPPLVLCRAARTHRASLGVADHSVLVARHWWPDGRGSRLRDPLSRALSGRGRSGDRSDAGRAGHDSLAARRAIGHHSGRRHAASPSGRVRRSGVAGPHAGADRTSARSSSRSLARADAGWPHDRGRLQPTRLLGSLRYHPVRLWPALLEAAIGGAAARNAVLARALRRGALRPALRAPILSALGARLRADGESACLCRVPACISSRPRNSSTDP